MCCRWQADANMAKVPGIAIAHAVNFSTRRLSLCNPTFVPNRKSNDKNAYIRVLKRLHFSYRFFSYIFTSTFCFDVLYLHLACRIVSFSQASYVLELWTRHVGQTSRSFYYCRCCRSVFFSSSFLLFSVASSYFILQMTIVANARAPARCFLSP